MYAEKFELLEAKIRETAMLVSRLREEKRQLEWENEQLRARLAELEEQLQRSQGVEERYVPSLDSLLQQLDTLQQGEESLQATPPPRALPALPEVAESDPSSIEDHVQRGMFYEQQGQYEPAIHAYQDALDVDSENLEAAQRLAFLLEKLNRDAEAAALWDKIWAMREAQSSTRQRRRR
jgi:tetratricopeptide (TPR) repeat protein